MKHMMANQRGFTLVEVLIALALMALLSIISWQALDLTERSSVRLNTDSDDILALVRVLGQIESDIRRHADDDILSSLSDAGTASSSGPMLPIGILWTVSMLTITRSAQNGAWQKVVWFQDGDMLRRAEGATSHTLPLPEAETGEAVLEHVQQFALRGWVPGQGWMALESNEIKSSVTGLEVVIERQRNGVNETYRKVVLLP